MPFCWLQIGEECFFVVVFEFLSTFFSIWGKLLDFQLTSFQKNKKKTMYIKKFRKCKFKKYSALMFVACKQPSCLRRKQEDGQHLQNTNIFVKIKKTFSNHDMPNLTPTYLLLYIQFSNCD